METLSSSVLQIRNSFLEQFKNEQLETISKKLDELFDAIKLEPDTADKSKEQIKQIKENLLKVAEDEANGKKQGKDKVSLSEKIKIRINCVNK